MHIKEIKALAKLEPFRRFAIVFDSGRELIVESDTELLFPKKQPNLVIAFASGSHWIFEAESVTALRNEN